MNNATDTNYFTTFLQTAYVANFYWFSSKLTINIIFLFINNHWSHQQFVKFFIK